MAGQDEKGSSNAPTAMKDKLDLNLSPTNFLTPVGNIKMQETFAFDTQDDDDSMSISSDQTLPVQVIALIHHCKQRPLL